MVGDMLMEHIMVVIDSTDPGIYIRGVSSHSYNNTQTGARLLQQMKWPCRTWNSFWPKMSQGFGVGEQNTVLS